MTSETVTKEEHTDETKMVCVTHMPLFFNLKYLTLITIFQSAHAGDMNSTVKGMVGMS